MKKVKEKKKVEARMILYERTSAVSFILQPRKLSFPRRYFTENKKFSINRQLQLTTC